MIPFCASCFRNYQIVFKNHSGHYRNWHYLVCLIILSRMICKKAIFRPLVRSTWLFFIIDDVIIVNIVFLELSQNFQYRLGSPLVFLKSSHYSEWNDMKQVYIQTIGIEDTGIFQIWWRHHLKWAVKSCASIFTRDLVSHFLLNAPKS